MPIQTNGHFINQIRLTFDFSDLVCLEERGVPLADAELAAMLSDGDLACLLIDD